MDTNVSRVIVTMGDNNISPDMDSATNPFTDPNWKHPSEVEKIIEQAATLSDNIRTLYHEINNLKGKVIERGCRIIELESKNHTQKRRIEDLEKVKAELSRLRGKVEASAKKEDVSLSAEAQIRDLKATKRVQTRAIITLRQEIQELKAERDKAVAEKEKAEEDAHMALQMMAKVSRDMLAAQDALAAASSTQPE